MVLKDKITDIKNYWRKHESKILPWFTMGRETVFHATQMPIEPHFYDYIQLGFNVKDTYVDIFKGSILSHLIQDGEALLPMNPGCCAIMIELVKQYGTKFVFFEDKDSECFCYRSELNGIRINWCERESVVDGVTCFPAEETRLFEEVGKLFDMKYPTKKVMIGSFDDKMSITEDLTQKDFISFKKCKDMKTYINKFLTKDINRSILFYGPPGSGKSNLIKGIVDELGFRTMKFADLEEISANNILHMVKLYQPDCIILEDIDHWGEDSVQSLLEKIENIHVSVKLIMASANKAWEMTDALVRPGRFDEAIEIKHLDKEVVMNIIGKDKQIFTLVKEFPVAYIREVMKRVEALGKKEALSNLGDIYERLENMNFSNYGLVKKKSKKAIDKMLSDMPDDLTDFEALLRSEGLK